MNLNTKPARFTFVDQLRGFSVFIMIIFHLFYDLNHFKLIEINMRTTFWYWYPRFIVFLFLFTMGISLVLVHFPKLKLDKIKQRIFKIGGYALLISLVTYFAFPSFWIYFGTLHCIAVSTVLAIPFIKRPKLSLFLSILILVCWFSGVRVPLNIYTHHSLDYIPVYPWFSIVLFGIFAAHKKWHVIKFPDIKIFRVLSKKALIIYLLHQPILFGICYLLKQI